MPTLDWIGKKAVVNHHRAVPYHLLKCDKELSVGDPGSGNLLVQGDNLLALKALLPYYAGCVKCIYIDPPYNTGNENWIYNDAVNSPEIRKWLGKVVGAEAEDLSRHDKWLCMMYPRLVLLREFLRDDGAIFISIADHEVHNLRHVMDEIFGPRNFIASVIWQKVYSPKNSARHFSEDHDYIIVYAKNSEQWRPHLVSRTSKQDKAYKNPDNDPRGPWKTSDLSARNPYSKGTYAITCPSGRVIQTPPKGSYWRYSEENFKKLDSDGRIWWGKDGNSIPQIKRFLQEVKQGIVPQTLWKYEDVGHTQDAKKELVAICDFPDSASVFITPKPTKLVKRILEIATDKNSLVLDSFAGSGTTGHAVLDLNKADGGNRQFILVEIEESICQAVTAQRLTRVVQGHNDIPALGGGYRYCRLGVPIFDETGNIRAGVSFSELATHVYFAETGEPIPTRKNGKSPLLGVHNSKAIYLLFNGILGDRSPGGGNVLTNTVLKSLPPNDGPRVIYGEGCRLGKARLKREGIVFKQIPYGIKVS
ncbi:MAG: site-specific DNA-methyltransferase [Dehalococcoidia bacterium]|jgi:site-specific DNA-methyltransferase (adenine-specific)/adenine-specific DNA-methyltransferase